MGTGKLILQIPEALLSNRLPSLVVRHAHPRSFSSGVKRRAYGAHPSGIRGTHDKTETEEEHSGSREALFTCPKEGCTQTFLRHSSMIQHLDCGTQAHFRERDNLRQSCPRICGITRGASHGGASSQHCQHTSRSHRHITHGLGIQATCYRED